MRKSIQKLLVDCKINGFAAYFPFPGFDNPSFNDALPLNAIFTNPIDDATQSTVTCGGLVQQVLSIIPLS
jgi:hypothetical protein